MTQSCECDKSFKIVIVWFWTTLLRVEVAGAQLAPVFTVVTQEQIWVWVWLEWRFRIHRPHSVWIREWLMAIKQRKKEKRRLCVHLLWVWVWGLLCTVAVDMEKVLWFLWKQLAFGEQLELTSADNLVWCSHKWRLTLLPELTRSDTCTKFCHEEFLVANCVIANILSILACAVCADRSRMI